MFQFHFWVSSFLWIDLLDIISTPCAHHEQFDRAGIYHIDDFFQINLVSKHSMQY